MSRLASSAPRSGPWFPSRRSRRCSFKRWSPREDADYFKHGGVDYMGMARAFVTNVLRGRKAQGGSTITQQVIKNLLLTPERKFKRKVQEIILAHRLSEKLTKEEILALYLNQIYYGHGRYGCEEAARYLLRQVGEARSDLAEASLLAGLPQSPERLSPRKHPDAAKARQRYVLGQMADNGYIDRKTADTHRRPADSPGARDARPRAGWRRRRSTS
jgi:penicillin-binding protein 1A